MDPDLVSRLLFWAFTAIILVAPLRTSVFVYLLLSQIDASGPGFGSTSSVGFENLVRIAIIPSLLAWRLGVFADWRKPWGMLGKSWLLFTAWAAVAVAWSPYQLSAAKMIAYLISYALLFGVFAKTWERGLLTPKLIVANIYAVLMIGVIETYLCGNPFGTLETIDRFTTFASPQTLAAYLASMVAVLSVLRPLKAIHWLGIAAAVVGVIGTGSRYVLAGLIVLGLVVALLFAEKISFAAYLRRITLALLLIIILVGSLRIAAPESRLNEIFGAADITKIDVEDVPTFAWRIQIYLTAIDDISNWEKKSWIIGEGTSSAGDVILRAVGFDVETVDPNRAMHNEFLRALYEWGLIGLALFIGVLVVIVLQQVRWWRNGIVESAAALVLFPTILISLCVENILAASGGPTSCGFLLCLTLGYANCLVAKQSELVNVA